MVELDVKKSGGLIPAVAQDWQSGEVLMLAYINKEAWEETLSTGHAVYYSRSRQKLWRKGESSGNVQLIKDIAVDCDCDTVVFKVDQIGGAACHTGHRSCFYTHIGTDGSVSTDNDLVFDPEKVYGTQEGK